MSYERLAYDDQDTALQMRTDCTACASEMGIPEQRIMPDALGAAPSIAFADFPREIRKPEITVSDAAAHLASRIHLHWD
ncbi:hypothetical protein EFK50_06980 [Nocardioides marmoriginsengisoli]|uniref:Uncharacterized protein n=1 Tax=Nocardioides marmoriginsengisoli TaxID=661483 RepID=A0A3N0CMI3_9ACTN|nr:hypothetical protein [Nocardioides marmoriginsengisoli]RNL64266.1 hypothetical protein EFK50_06980 [Nocardioides marmoriginsengisoli]